MKRKIARECISGGVIYSYSLDKEITMDFVKVLGKLGNLQVHENLPEPFFKVEIDGYDGKSVISGIVGYENLRFIVPPSMDEKEVERIENFIKDNL